AVGNAEGRGRRRRQRAAGERGEVHASLLEQVAAVVVHARPAAALAFLIGPGVLVVALAVLGVEEGADVVLHGPEPLGHFVAEGLHGGKDRFGILSGEILRTVREGRGREGGGREEKREDLGQGLTTVTCL